MSKKPVVIITGASKGIGFEAAKDLLSRNWQVVLIARNQSKLEEAHTKLDSDNAHFFAGDVSDLPVVEKIVQQCFSSWGRIDALINNASVIEPIGYFHEQNGQKWMDLLKVNIGGIFNTCKTIIPIMLKQKGGCIVNLSSGAAHNPISGWSSYCSSKSATVMLTRCLHGEYGHQGIRFHSFIPGAVATDMLNKAYDTFENVVTQRDKSDLLPAALPGRCLGWIVAEGHDLEYGSEESIRDPKLRVLVGLPEGYKW